MSSDTAPAERIHDVPTALRWQLAEVRLGIDLARAMLQTSTAPNSSASLGLERARDRMDIASDTLDELASVLCRSGPIGRLVSVANRLDLLAMTPDGHPAPDDPAELHQELDDVLHDLREWVSARSVQNSLF